MDFRLQALEQASYLGAQPVHALGDGARLRHDGMTGIGQLRFARRPAVEQRDPKLRLQISNRIADDRCRPTELSRRARETADIDETNNSWPVVKTESKFEVFKAKQGAPRAIPQTNNPMQLTGKDKKAF